MDEARVPGPLDTSHRCDACKGASQAMVAVVLHSGGTLYLCLHHYRKHFDALFERAAYVRDDSKRLLAS